ncbi:WD40-repeat-containing domain protein [Blastocladiella britannica]|nr:WD40-repeat-containing domain protein [Blastocladiella britannica]
MQTSRSSAAAAAAAAAAGAAPPLPPSQAMPQLSAPAPPSLPPPPPPPPQHGPSFARLAEYLDAARHDLDALVHEYHASMAIRAQRDELEARFNVQLQDMTFIQRQLKDLEFAHARAKQQYHDDIRALQLEIQRSQAQVSALQQQLGMPSLPDASGPAPAVPTSSAPLAASSSGPGPLTSAPAATGHHLGHTQPQPLQQPHHLHHQQQLQLQQQQPPHPLAATTAAAAASPSGTFPLPTLAADSLAPGRKASVSDVARASPMPRSSLPPAATPSAGAPRASPAPPTQSASGQSAPSAPIAVADAALPQAAAALQSAPEHLASASSAILPPKPQQSVPPHPHQAAGNAGSRAGEEAAAAIAPIQPTDSPGSKQLGSAPSTKASLPAAETAWGPADGAAANLVPAGRKSGHGWGAIFLQTNKTSASSAAPSAFDVDVIHTLRHASVVCSVALSGNGRYVATGANKMAIVWDSKTGQRVASLNGDTVVRLQPNDAPAIGGVAPTGASDLYIRSLCFSPDSRLVASGAEDRIIRVWSFLGDGPRVERRFEGHWADIYSLGFSPDGRFLVSGSGDCTARIYDLEKETCIHVLQHDDEPSIVMLAAHKFDRTQVPATPFDLPEPRDYSVTSVAFSPCGQFVATGSLDKYVRVFDLATGTLLDRLQSHQDSVYSLAFRPKDGRQLVSGSLDCCIAVWDIPDYRPLAAIARETETSARIALAAQAPIVSASLTRMLRGHRDFVLSLAYDPSGRYVVSGSKDRGVYLWDLSTSEPLMVLQGHRNSCISVALGAFPLMEGEKDEGELILVSGSGDQRARLWRISKAKGTRAESPARSVAAEGGVRGNESSALA